MLDPDDNPDCASQSSKKFNLARRHIRQLRASISRSLSGSPTHEIGITRSSLPSRVSNSTAPKSGLTTVSSSSCPSLNIDIPRSRLNMDGVTEKLFIRRPQEPPPGVPSVSAIFVHAGAGYHSTTNENIHLAACDKYVTPSSINLEGRARRVMLMPYVVRQEWQ